MIKSLRHLTGRDKRALAAFYSVTVLCSLYFASGILVTYVSEPPDEMAAAADGGYIVRVQGLPTYADAEQLSNALREHRRVQTVIEAIPSDRSYLIKIGPLAKLDTAKTLTNELQNSGYSLIKIMENCQPGSDCGPSQAAGQRK